MFILKAEKNKLSIKEKETITSGSVSVYRVKFIFDEAWDDLDKTAVFRVGSETASVPLDRKDSCEIPWELITDKKKNIAISCGVNGRRNDGSVILPTIWIELGRIVEGAAISDTVQRPCHKSAYDEVLDKLNEKGDNISYSGDTLTLLSGETPLSSATIHSGGGGDFDFATDDDIKNIFMEE